MMQLRNSFYFIFVFMISHIFIGCFTCNAQPALQSLNILAHDTESDSGNSITVSWALSETDTGLYQAIKKYEIYRSQAIGGPWELVGEIPAGILHYIDSGVENDVGYFYKIQAMSDRGILLSKVSDHVFASPNWFNWKELWIVVVGIWVLLWIWYYIRVAASGKSLYIRKIAGIEAVEDAVGRATEMGRSVLFIPGIQDMDNVQTVAGITILSSIAKKTAEYETKLSVPVSRSIVMSTGRETVKEAYIAKGRPDLFYEEMVFYVTDEQFGYVAAVDGIMVREKPATCFYMGAFFAESLILAETGNYIGAIQIAGTAMPTQLPFFVAACDYTLIGEELFAASAYLSKDPRIIGSLRGQDMGKLTAMFFIILGTIILTLSSFSGNKTLLSIYDFLQSMFSIS
ncbi:MAG: hypothetical protein A2161_00465 [Candidatus Schekmanbacteria bacterium RBG_13_48_7]|uniref:DUF6754 domain-containing protein n=1 Tax=Candidatus Schekmanbacteria bacterium RBG_13_48_7 TaxID=1817878 RepID=A0A1F7RKB0_9BACT|nr:MAG: hypothetical protein A2161_00465 [Candidatus Schekmanbacteria bacterium RBG_13_48_7]